MNVIYTPRGRAGEYSNLAVNLYSGCGHRCTYCYAPACIRMDRENFDAQAVQRNQFLKKLRADLQKIEGSDEKVLLCFTTDPYNPTEAEHQMTRSALQLFRDYKVAFQVLTKGGMRASRDYDLYSSNDAYACSLTFADDERSIKTEGGAALPGDRIRSLKLAKSLGITTWVSFEPVLCENSVYELYDKTKDFVDLFKVGKCSGPFSEVKDWKRFGENIVNLMERDGSSYYLKRDLVQAMR